MRRILIEKEMTDPKHCSFGFPWENDSTCFKFEIPEECVLAEDIDKITDKDNIETLVIGCDLDSYDFISDMVNLRFLYIYEGSNVRSLDFVEKLVRLQQLYIVNTHISDLSPLYPLVVEKERLINKETSLMKGFDYMISGICIETDKEIEDAYKLLNAGVHITELIIGRKRIRS